MIELYYRIGRVNDALNNSAIASKNYQKTIDLGRNSSYYYAAKSALQLALIWENKGDYKKAQYYFNDCIAMENHEYEQSIEQKAKAGLHRLSEK
jgi:tetratricopeptide (TPR) repeat protein